MATGDHNHHVVQWRLLNDPARHVRDWLIWSLRSNRDDHVHRYRRLHGHSREISEARAKLQSLSSERLERLSALGLLDAHSEIAADQVIADRRRRDRQTNR